MSFPLLETARLRFIALLKHRPLGIYLLIAICLLTVLSLHYLLTAHAFAFYDIGSDTFFQFFPLQIVQARQLHELHSISWSFDLGLGGYVGSLFDPFMLLTGWLPESWQLGSRLPMFAVRVISAGGFFYAYLRLIRFEPHLAILGALGYAFSSYGMLNAQWEVMHGTEFVQLAIFLYLLEKYLATQNRWAPIAAGIVVGLGHPMGLYMFGLFGLLYALARSTTIPAGERLSYFRAIPTFAAWCIPGLLLVAPLLFPALYYFFESPRVSGDHSALYAELGRMFRINDRATLSAELAGLFGKDLLGSNLHYAGWANYFEGPGFYVGMLPLLCIPQLLAPGASRVERRLCIIGVIGIAAYFAFPALRTAVYGFGESAFRFSTLWISAILLVLGLAGLRRILTGGVWRPGLGLAVLFVFGIPLAGALFLPARIDYVHLSLVFAFGGAYGAIAWHLTRDSTSRSSVLNLLIPVVACELLVFAIPTVVQRNAVTLDAASAIGSYHDGTDQALAYVRDYQRQFSGNDDFYRVDKTYYSVFLDDALIQNYHGTASYFFHATAITRFVDRMNLDRVSPSPNYISSMSNRRDVMDLLGVRYLLSRDRKPDAERDLAYLATVDGIDIYRNATAHGFGTFYSSIAAEARADALPVPQRDVFLLDNVTVDDPASIESELTRLGSDPHHAGLQQRADISTRGDDVLTGTVQTPKAALLLLAMPFDRGWSATLGGKPVHLFRADYGLTAVLVPPGQHAIALAYVAPGRRVGIGACLLCVGFLLLLWRSQRAKPAPLRRMLHSKA
ncbi:MAG: YfhO family protein [Proteobacteria bacterium]|nr:YfhO family protein [Pseudomonadota bacterium]